MFYYFNIRDGNCCHRQITINETSRNDHDDIKTNRYVLNIDIVSEYTGVSWLQKYTPLELKRDINVFLILLNAIFSR